MAFNKLEKLRSLAHLDIDAIGAYEEAMKQVHNDAVHAKLAEFRVDHARHVQDLNTLIVKLGGHAVELASDFKGRVLKVMTRATGVFGTEAALLAMVGNEEITTRTYDAAAKEEWDDEARKLIERNQADEHRHLAWIKQAIRERPWAHEEPAHP